MREPPRCEPRARASQHRASAATARHSAAIGCAPFSFGFDRGALEKVRVGFVVELVRIAEHEGLRETPQDIVRAHFRKTRAVKIPRRQALPQRRDTFARRLAESGRHELWLDWLGREGDLDPSQVGKLEDSYANEINRYREEATKSAHTASCVRPNTTYASALGRRRHVPMPASTFKPVSLRTRVRSVKTVKSRVPSRKSGSRGSSAAGGASRVAQRRIRTTPAIAASLAEAVTASAPVKRKDQEADSRPRPTVRKSGTALATGDAIGAAGLARRVGQRLRDERQARDLSLDDLSRASGVSRAALSQIETLKSSPSIAVMWKIAVGLGIPFAELLGSDSDEGMLLRRADAQVLRSADGRFETRPVIPAGTTPWVEVYELRLSARTVHKSEPHAPGTRELLVVLSGALNIEVGPKTYELEAGDSVAFRADQEHAYRNPGTSEARAHNVIIYNRA
jgi:transcriptional regulator with XRE-family HTH domain